MKRIAICLGCTLALALVACSSSEEQLEKNIRENLASRGTVKQVDLTQQDSDHLSGFAVVTLANGTDSRLNCTATRDATKGAGHFDWRCIPAIDEAMLTQIEGSIRQGLAGRANVISVEMTKQDENRMTGVAVVGDNYGNQARVPCNATRNNDANGAFSWQCGGEGPSAQAAPAPDSGSGPAPEAEPEPTGDK